MHRQRTWAVRMQMRQAWVESGGGSAFPQAGSKPAPRRCTRWLGQLRAATRRVRQGAPSLMAVPPQNRSIRWPLSASRQKPSMQDCRRWQAQVNHDLTTSGAERRASALRQEGPRPFLVHWPRNSSLQTPDDLQRVLQVWTSERYQHRARVPLINVPLVPPGATFLGSPKASPVRRQ